jgi:hypothetical protein
VTTMQTVDFKKTLKAFYTASTQKPDIIDVPPMNFLMIDGAGDPNTSVVFREAVQALYTLAYTLRFSVKMEQNIAYTVMPLQGLWWVEGELSLAVMKDKDDWLWTLMIMQPDFIASEMFTRAVDEARRKKNLSALGGVRLESFHEGKAVQLMHLGPYHAEQPNIERLHQFVADAGYELTGKHHEIYLSDPGRTASEKMRTIIRNPIRAR